MVLVHVSHLLLVMFSFICIYFRCYSWFTICTQFSEKKRIKLITCEKLYIVHDIFAQDTNGVQPNNNFEKDKVVPEPKKIIGRDICKEFEGVKAFGTVNNYMPSMNLFEV